MKHTQLRLLPSIAIGRLGSADEPLENYSIVTNPEEPLNFRKIKREATLVIDTRSGEVVKELPPDDSVPNFKKDGKIKPVAPFIEAYIATKGATGDGEFEPLTQDYLDANGLTARWQVSFGNFKAYRRTYDKKDKIKGSLDDLQDHQQHAMLGYCKNFLDDDAGNPKFIECGKMQFIKPSAEFNQIRLRFTPACGAVFGSTPSQEIPPQPATPQEMGGPAHASIVIPPERIVYDSDKGKWNGHIDDNATLNTYGQGLYAAYNKVPFYNYYEDPQPALGYLDDTCDGIVKLELVDVKGKVRFSDKARFCSAPPLFAPDSEFFRTVEDELEQVLLGPTVKDPDSIPMDKAATIIRRAYETVRFMNLSVLNNDPVKGRPNTADTMVANDCDIGRPKEPIMATQNIDTLSITALHQQIYSALQAGAVPWFVDHLRTPEEVGDLTDKGRRKMPAMMSGADGLYVTLTYRQLDILKHAGRGSLFDTPTNLKQETLTPRNRTAQLHFRGKYNSVATHVSSSIGNCCPGLELDFRSVWKRSFEGITLMDHNNFVVDADKEHKALKHRRLLFIELPQEHGEPICWPVTTQLKGPNSYGDATELLTSVDNPDAVSNKSWADTLAFIWAHTGKELICHFTKTKVKSEAPQTWIDPQDPHKKTYTKALKVRNFFAPESSFINEALADPGELTQGLCSPWQNDFRECVCYYWASSRPDYINVEPADNGGSVGDNWMTKGREGRYVVDDYRDNRLINYQDLFYEWESVLKFQLQGKDAPEE